jgi:hypothetical protein
MMDPFEGWSWRKFWTVIAALIALWIAFLLLVLATNCVWALVRHIQALPS